MDGKSYFFQKKKTSIIIGLIASFSGLFILGVEQNAYELSPSDAQTFSMNKTITIEANGDVRFVESLSRYFSTSVFFQDIYFTSNHEDIPPTVSQPAFDTTQFQTEIFDTQDRLLVSSQGQRTDVIVDNYQLRLGYSWDPQSIDEFGDPIEPLDDESVSWFHYHEGTWGTIRIENDYRIRGVALKYADTAEFYWVVASTDNMKTENVDVKIYLPGIYSSRDQFTSYIHGSSLANIHHQGIEEDGRAFVHIQAPRLYPGEFITTRINFPAAFLMIDSAQNALYGNDVQSYPIANGLPHLTNVATYENARAQQRFIYSLTDGVAIVILIGLLILTGWQTRNIYLQFDREHRTDFYGEYYRELPATYGPAIMGYLYRFKEITKDDVTATLMDLIRRKVILLDAGQESMTEAKVNYVMKLNPASDQSQLLAHEQQLIKWFFGLVAGGDTLSLKQLEQFTRKEQQAIRYLNENQAFNRALASASERQQFFDDVKMPAQKNAWVLGLLGIFGFGLMALRLLLALGTYTAVMGGVLFGAFIMLQAYVSSIERRSIKGNEEYVRWKAFEKFLKEFTNIKDYPMPGITIWEHYMVYATAFGIADLVEKQVRFKYQSLNQTNQLQQSAYFRYPGFYRYYYLSMSRSFSSASQTIAKAQAQRNNSAGKGGRFGGGGGFSGGGGSGVRIR